MLLTQSLLNKEISKSVSGNFALIKFLQSLGIKHYAGVNGGGVIKLAQHLLPLTHLSQVDESARMLTMNEYIAGFVPLGSYLATGTLAGTILTTGAATKLGLCGLSEAKLHNIPAVFIVALNSTNVHDSSPLQDVTEHGMNLLPQLEAELGDGCIVIDDLSVIEEKICTVHKILQQSRPVVIAFHPNILSQDIDINQLTLSPAHPPNSINYLNIEALISQITQQKNQRIILYVGEEAARYEGISPLIDKLSYSLKSPIIWSVNGANAVSETNPYGYGHILFGGNDRALELWQSINEDDVMIMIGFDPHEYILNCEQIKAGQVWHLTDFEKPYGHQNGTFEHRTAFKYNKISGNLNVVLQEILNRLPFLDYQNYSLPSHQSLNTRNLCRDVNSNTVNLVSFYENLQQHWQPNSIGFDDICMAYKDRPYLMQRRHPNIKFYSMYHGSAMGGAFGLGCGAKLANPSLHTFVFSGDGCWRLYGGALADASRLGLRLFIMNNSCYGIIEQGAPSIIPGLDKGRYHSHLPNIDFVAAAKAHGWDAYLVKPDLSNISEIMEACYDSSAQSILIEVPVDAAQIIGINPRINNLRGDCHL